MPFARKEDIGKINAVASICGLPHTSKEDLEKYIYYVGEYGYFILDMQDKANAIAHVAIVPCGRGKWAIDFLHEFIRWAFTSTTIERINAAVPASSDHVAIFAKNAWFRKINETDKFVYMDLDIHRWIALDKSCSPSASVEPDNFEFNDPEMQLRVSEACSMMHEGGMEHKAWYIYRLYAKLFGYKVED